ncbi:TetR/AcrR family transcriptional regulator [Kineosporia sp. J2-2]|uniref:TetR/AcrR family transcriptional regulator n=1 Tax=Kineosporia corallincola TaxID=2835133 RepID=A0ABS5TB36_9ACTN|nr:TetR/AcrR family transcriptional regulator [Kineosporia corallincola]MBT0768290.1 TetR/AcrR family transcriptional regulator [Kineosporia corallincola]
MPAAAGGRRERHRREAIDEIKQLAMRQLAESGTTGISLNAIARQMGMSGPALYRYFAGRDALLTALIRDGYTDLAQTLTRTTEDGASLPPARRLHTMAAAFRDWALAEPQRYLLLFGTPVPGYRAPADTTETALHSLELIAAVVAELPTRTTRTARQEDTPLERAVVMWTRMHGVLSLELTGSLTYLDLDPARLFEREVEAAITM